MRHFLILGVALLGMVACDPNGDSPVDPTYPTDRLELSNKKNHILVMRTDLSSTAGVNFSVLQESQRKEFGNQFIPITIFGQSAPLYTPNADTLGMQLGAESIGLYVDGESSIMMMEEDFEELKAQEPFISIAHAGGENDTAWYVDVKVRFNRDTNISVLYINTYLLSNFAAADTGIFDFRYPAFQDIVTNIGGESRYGADFISPYDSSKIATKGNAIVHKDVVLYNNPHLMESRGLNFVANEFNPFGVEFFAGDVLGTRFTPIRLYIKKPENVNPLILDLIKPNFLTVLWMRDLEMGGWEYVNAYKGK